MKRGGKELRQGEHGVVNGQQVSVGDIERTFAISAVDAAVTTLRLDRKRRSLWQLLVSIRLILLTSTAPMNMFRYTGACSWQRHTNDDVMLDAYID